MRKENPRRLRRSAQRGDIRRFPSAKSAFFSAALPAGESGTSAQPDNGATSYTLSGRDGAAQSAWHAPLEHGRNAAKRRSPCPRAPTAGRPAGPAASARAAHRVHRHNAAADFRRRRRHVVIRRQLVRQPLQIVGLSREILHVENLPPAEFRARRTSACRCTAAP